MKKRFFIAICLLLSLCLASCEYADLFFTTGSTIITHTHLWESEWEHDETHHWHECKDITCNEVDSKEAHIWDEGTLTKEPTEAEAGEKTYKCIVCEKIKVEKVEKSEHCHEFLNEWSIDETYHWHECKDATCNEVDSKETHIWDEGILTKEPTEVEEGEKTYKCIVCEKIKVEKVEKSEHYHKFSDEWSIDETHHWHAAICEHDTEVSEKEEHTLVKSVVPVTCTQAGYTIYTCKCGYNYTEAVVEAKGHHFIDGKCHCGEQYVEWVLATEIKDGDNVLIGAPAYGKLLSAEKVNATSFYNKGVNYSSEDFSLVTDSEIFVVTVHLDGSYTFTSKTDIIIALADSYSSLSESGTHKAWQAIEKSEGLFYLKNTGRGNYLEWYDSKGNWSTYSTSNPSDLFEISFYKKETKLDEVHVHNYISEVHDVTCTKDGYKSFTCECGDTYTEAGEKAVGHKYSSEVTAPTCTENGIITYTCDCGDSYTEAGETAKGHTFVEGKCHCGEFDLESHVHSYQSEVTAPTCTEDGYTTYTCECGDTYTEAGEAATGEHIDTNLDITCDYEGCTKRILPAADSKISLFTANHMIIVSVSSRYYVEGVVIEVTDAKNGAFVIQDEAGDTILIRLPKNADSVAYSSWTIGKVVVGDTIQVYGKPAKNSSAPTTQKAKVEGGILTVLKHEHKFSEANCTEPSICGCLSVGAPALGHIDANTDDSCDRCGWNMKFVVDSIVIATDPALANGVKTPGADGKAASWTWSNDNFDAIIAKGTSTLTLYTTAKAYMQLKKQNTFTIVNKNELKIQSIIISTTNTTQLTNLVRAIGDQFSIEQNTDKLTVTITGLDITGDFTFSNVGSSTAYINGVEIVYEK